MKKLILLVIIIHIANKAYTQNECERALTNLSTVEYYVEEIDEVYKLEHLNPKNGFILYTLDDNDDIYYPFEENSCQPSKIKHELVLCPFKDKHEHFVGFEECINCNGVPRYRYLYLYDGNTNNRITGVLICK
ncbi:MAG: hypothetical protein ACFB15_18610 [Cyclobacteriaceae bacterium]